MEYSKEKLNEILLSKSLDDFYLAIIERKLESLNEEQNIGANDIKTSQEENEALIDELLTRIDNEEELEIYSPYLKKFLYKFTGLRYIGILTLVGNRVYDIANRCFLDPNSCEIVIYDNLANYYDNDQAGVEYYTQEEDPRLEEASVLISIDDEKPIYKFENDYIDQVKSEDLTSFFKKEACQRRLVLDPNELYN